MHPKPVVHIRSQMPWLSWIYVASVALQPLNIFIFSDGSTSGLGMSASRLLQAVVLIGLSLRVSAVAVSRRSATTLAIPSLVNPLYLDYTKYFCCAVVAGLVGVSLGAYDLPAAYDNLEGTTRLSRFLFQPNLRPVIEYFINAYYFVYFAILPVYLLRSQKDVGHLLSAVKVTVCVSMAAGVISLGLNYGGIPFLPRNFADWNDQMGARFHGLFGEPGDAVGYLFLGLAMLHLGAFHKGVKLRKLWTILIIAAAMATQSTFGLVGITCFMGLYAVYSIGKINARRALQFVGMTALVSGLIYASFVNSPRMNIYAEDSLALWTALENGEQIPGRLASHRAELYPLYDLTVKLRNLEILPIVIGSGFGSTSAVSNRLSVGIKRENLNPQSQLVRTIYEVGLVGLYYFVVAFVRPVQRLTKGLPSGDRHRFVTLSLLVVGCCLGNRNAAPFILLGALIAMLRARQDPVARMSG